MVSQRGSEGTKHSVAGSQRAWVSGYGLKVALCWQLETRSGVIKFSKWCENKFSTVALKQ